MTGIFNIHKYHFFLTSFSCIFYLLVDTNGQHHSNLATKSVEMKMKTVTSKLSTQQQFTDLLIIYIYSIRQEGLKIMEISVLCPLTKPASWTWFAVAFHGLAMIITFLFMIIFMPVSNHC